MKKIWLSMLVLTMVLTACGKGSVPVPSSSAETEASSEAGGQTDQTAASEAEHADLPSGTVNWLCMDYGDVGKKMIETYNDTHNPNVTVNIESYQRPQLLEVIEVKMGAGDSNYDIFYVDQPLIASYSWKDYLAPLDAYLTQEELGLITESDLKPAYVDSELMALPMNSSSQVLMVNKDLLKEYGIEIEDKYLERSDRITWEELVEICTTFQQAADPNHAKGLWGFGFAQQDNVYQVLALGNSLGEDAIGEDGYTIEGYLNTDGWVKALQFYQDLYKNHQVSPVGASNDEIKELFYSGKVCFYLANTVRAQAADFDIGAMYHPYFEREKVAVPTGSWYIAINKNSRNMEAALDFFKWLTVGEGAEYYMIYNNQVPARTDLLAKITNGELDNIKEWPGSALKIAAEENLNGNGYPRPISPGFDEFNSVMTSLFQDLRGGADVKSSLDGATAQLSSSFMKFH